MCVCICMCMYVYICIYVYVKPQLCDWLPVSGSNCVVVFSQVVPNFSTWLHRADEDQKVRNTCPRLLLFPLRAYP